MSQKFSMIGFAPKAIKTLVAPGLDGLRIAIRGDVGGVPVVNQKTPASGKPRVGILVQVCESTKVFRRETRFCCFVFNARSLLENFESQKSIVEIEAYLSVSQLQACTEWLT